MPDPPVMDVAPRLRVGFIKGSAGGRACRPIEDVGVLCSKLIKEVFSVSALQLRSSQKRKVLDLYLEEVQ